MTAFLRRTFAGFWSVNVGHIGIFVIFIFGLGTAWRNVAATQDADRAAAAARDTQIIASVRSAVDERNLKLEAIDARLTREENLDPERQAQAVKVAALSAQMTALEEQIRGLREDLRTWKK